ncbi:MAG: hypothetical protein H6925_06960 [Holosporaceae bacterium]|nr:MAG: hypothetical protein H6925_06960 [Holosporaceae bacterium]
MGESGSGKSTLAFSIVRLAKYSGTVVFGGKIYAMSRGRNYASCAQTCSLCFKIRTARSIQS